MAGAESIAQVRDGLWPGGEYSSGEGRAVAGAGNIAQVRDGLWPGRRI